MHVFWHILIVELADTPQVLCANSHHSNRRTVFSFIPIGPSSLGSLCQSTGRCALAQLTGVD
jgi:hypothetical protein